MPTSRPRHMVTETPELRRALDDAAARWPELTSRSALLARLAVEGGRLLDVGGTAAVARRRAALDAHAGELAQHYERARGERDGR